MDPRIQLLAILENMRHLFGSTSPQFSYWRRRVNSALVDDKDLFILLKNTQDGQFHD